MSWRWLALGGVLVACLGYLVVSATAGSAQYYQTIAELRSHPVRGSDVRVVGVVQDDVVRSEGGLRVRFTAADGGQRMPVTYRGTLPDVFKPGVQVVVQGRMGPDGVFHASVLEAKCPSKFSSATAQGSSAGR